MPKRYLTNNDPVVPIDQYATHGVGGRETSFHKRTHLYKDEATGLNYEVLTEPDTLRSYVDLPDPEPDEEPQAQTAEQAETGITPPEPEQVEDTTPETQESEEPKTSSEEQGLETPEQSETEPEAAQDPTPEDTTVPEAQTKSRRGKTSSEQTPGDEA